MVFLQQCQMLISNLTQMKTNIFAKVQTWLSDGEMTGLTLIVSVCNYNNDEVVPLCHRKYRERVLSTVRLGNFLAFSQSLDSAALPAGEDHLVSEQQRLVMEEGGGSPARMVSRDRRTAGDDNPFSPLQFLAGLVANLPGLSAGLSMGFSAILIPQLQQPGSEITATLEEGSWIGRRTKIKGGQPDRRIFTRKCFSELVRDR